MRFTRTDNRPSDVARCIRAFLVIALGLACSAATAEEFSLTQSWRPNQTHVFDHELNSMEGRSANLDVPPTFDEEGLVRFSEDQLLHVEQDGRALPQASFAVEAWTRVDKPTRWGTVVGFQQDNGNYEKGWSLGYNEDRFEFRVSNGKKLINCTAAQKMTLGGWHHVVGVCDTKRHELRLYVDGKRDATATFDANGPAYPDGFDTELVIGGYQDHDEIFPMAGRIREARIYTGVLPEETIEAHVAWMARLPDKPLKFSVRPGVRFLSPTSAELRWETTIAGQALVGYGPTRKLGTIVRSDSDGTSHRVMLKDLKPGTNYFYRFALNRNGARSFSPFYELEGSMNYMPPEIDTWKFPPGALAVIDQIDQRGGYAVVLGERPAAWAEAIAAETSMSVVAALADGNRLQELREKWYREDRYGIRLIAQAVDDLPRRFANVVIGSAADMQQATGLLSPSGRLVCLGPAPTIDGVTWSLLESGVSWGEVSMKQFLSEWGHQYGSAANASFVGETLAGVDNTADLSVQWLGRPGADFGIDRNPRMPAPLAIGGRLFHQGMNRMIALDAFNGAVLWSLEIPDLRRVNIPRDCSNWCADRQHVFAAVKDRLWVIDAATGQMKQAFHLPHSYRQGHDWGFVADGGEVVIGTAVKASSAYESFWNKASWYDGKDDSATAKVCGSAIVAYGKQYGDIRWQRPVEAAVHSTITIAGDRLYFVEVDDPALQDATTGKLTNQQIWKNASVVCLDLKSGTELWKQKVPPQDDALIVSFGIADDNQFVLETSSDNRFHFVSLDRESGKQRWKKSVPWPEDHHGAHMQHAVLMNGKIFIQPHILDAKDGSLLKSGTLGKRRGCATPIGAGNSIIYRGGSGPLTLWSLKDDKPSEFARLRPSCWLSTVPAQGMLFSPEGGGGCSCGGWMETSIGFTPMTRKETQR